MKTATCFALLIAAALTSVAHGGSVYWTNVSGASLQTANDDGTGFETIVNNVSQPRGMAVDRVNGFSYWTELGELSIRRVSLHGNLPDEFVVDVRNGAAGIAFDLDAGKMYWTDSQDPDITAGLRTGKIRRSNLDGSNPEDVIAADIRHPAGIAIDPIIGKVYWSDLEGHLDGTGTIRRADLNGSNIETLLTDIDEANGLAIDLRHGKLYWTESASGIIQRANLDGSGMEDVLSDIPGLTTIALNENTNTMYWTEMAGDVKRAKINGTDQFTIATGVGEPWGIGVVPEPSSIALLIVALSSAGLLRRKSSK